MKLTASVIVRNELDRYLEPCLASLLEFCDEIRILDDSSTDGWEEALRPGWGKAGRRVVTYRHEVDARNGEPDFHLHAAARNRLLRFTLEGDPTYVLAIDGDEFISDGVALRAACDRGGDVITLEIAEVWEACDELLCIRQDGGWRSHPIGCVWSAAKFRRGALELIDRGHATGRVPETVHRVGSRPSGTSLLHFGWANLAERATRFERYSVGDGGRFHAAAHIESIMWPDSRVQLQPRSWPAWTAERQAAVLERASRA